MAFKFLVICALVAAANCGIIGAPYAAYPTHTTFTYPAAPAPTIVKTIAPAPTIVKQVQVEPAPAPAEYEFTYEVNNPETGDIKMQRESRKGDDVTGSYSLVEPDGLNRRIVDYTASEAGGFNAVVRREPVNAPPPPPPAPAPATITKVISPAPVITKYVQAPTFTKVLAPAPTVTKVIAPAGPSFSTFQLSSPLVKYGW